MSIADDRKIAIIHAYADGPYDRSSFHFAGNAHLVADVASFLALDAIDSLRSFHHRGNKVSSAEVDESTKATAAESRHPLIGLVDHISVFPLTTNGVDLRIEDEDENENEKFLPDDTSYIPPDSHGLSCAYIGRQLLTKDIDVLYYGSAHPNQTPLATVRREQTKFFKSGGLLENEGTGSSGKRSSQQQVEQCTVGSPPFFVENYNILLSKNVSRKEAMKLTKMIRARDGGVVGVEALTLPYSDSRFEVACNLLKPEEGSVNDIEKVLDQWVEQGQDLCNEEHGTKCSKSYLVDDSYRVGTTSEQCIEVLNAQKLNQNGYIEKHDNNVRQKFISYLSTT